MNSYLFHHHTREELKRMAHEGYAVVVPLAATEQHGPHLTIYTDSLICDHISHLAVEKANLHPSSNLLLAPMLPIGSSDHHQLFGGTLSFSPETYSRMLKEIGDSLVKAGFRKIIFLNAHGGNEHVMHQTAQNLTVEYPIWTASASYWNIAKEALIEVNADEVGPVPGHAGGFETSLIMALAANLVRHDQIVQEHPPLSTSRGISLPPKTFLGHHGELTGVDGYTDSAYLADGTKGEKYLKIATEAVADWLINIFLTMERKNKQ